MGDDGDDSADRLLDKIADMRYAAKQCERLATKTEQAVQAREQKVKQHIASGRQEVARVHASTMISQQQASIAYHKLSARLDAVATRLELLVRANAIISGIASLLPLLDSALDSMDIEQVDEVLNQFEACMIELEQRSSAIDSRMGKTTASSAPTEQVNNLMELIADRHGLDLKKQMSPVPLATPVTTTTNDVSDLLARYHQLKQK